MLSHCVHRYAPRCGAGRSAIISVRHYLANDSGHSVGVSCATVEVHPRTRKVVQIRGVGNRAVNSTIMTIIHVWSAAHELASTIQG